MNTSFEGNVYERFFFFLVLPHLGFLAGVKLFCPRELEYMPLAKRFKVIQGGGGEMRKNETESAHKH